MTEIDRADLVKALLEAARGHDLQARALRKEAGRELAVLRGNEPEKWCRLVDIDPATGEMLIGLAAGGMVRTGDGA